MAEAGTITDEAVARLRARVGIPEPHPHPPHYLRPDVDAFRHVAVSYGDDNPLWCDPDYAARTRWGAVIAPPPLVGGDTLVGEDEVDCVPADQVELMKGDPLRGVHAFYSGSAREWWAPLRPGRRVFRRNALVAVLDKASDFAGRAAHEWSGQVFRDDTGTLLSAQYRLMIRAERNKARSRKVRRRRARAVLRRPDQRDRVELRGRAATRRGAAMVGGRSRRRRDRPPGQGSTYRHRHDLLARGNGHGPLRGAAAATRLAQPPAHPGFFRDELNVPDVMQRVHWDPELARRSGNPTTYDYGRMRETWLIHLCTDWMGDDAWLWKLDCEFRLFNYVGDTQWLRGIVSRRYLADGARPAVDLDLRAENQRGQLTTPGHATILLPSREHGPVRLPEPPGGATDLQGALEAIAEGFEER